MENYAVLSLIPPILALVMVLMTRKVLLSLGTGIVVGAFILNWNAENGLFLGSIQQITEIVTGIFYTNEGINSWELYIIFFLLFLGIIATLITMIGGSAAFGDWALTKVKTRKGAQYTAGLLGIIIFIDDYFNSLTVGNVSRPFTDRHQVSRAKLAYIVDSTAAPMCVISPISSWGAYIISIIGGILVAEGVTQYEAFSAFMMIAPMNFYAIFAILLVFAVAYFSLDFGPMAIHEKRAVTTGELVDPQSGSIPGESEYSDKLASGKVMDLLLPIGVLIISTVFFMIFTGIEATDGTVSILAIFENTDVAAALVYGGMTSLFITIILSLKSEISNRFILKGIWAGVKSMLPAIYILIFAWTIVSIIDDLGTGDYLSSFIGESFPIWILPALLFILAGLMAFSTGTSWGTFAIMLPIAGTIAASEDITLMLPMLAAVLAGSIFGDHCSPISDTTILSSTGAGSPHIDHVLTQLPYALIVGFISIAAFLVLGFTGSVLLSLGAGLIIFGIIIILLKKFVLPRNQKSNSRKILE